MYKEWGDVFDAVVEKGDQTVVGGWRWWRCQCGVECFQCCLCGRGGEVSYEGGCNLGFLALLFRSGGR